MTLPKKITKVFVLDKLPLGISESLEYVENFIKTEIQNYPELQDDDAWEQSVKVQTYLGNEGIIVRGGSLYAIAISENECNFYVADVLGNLKKVGGGGTAELPMLTVPDVEIFKKEGEEYYNLYRIKATPQNAMYKSFEYIQGGFCMRFERATTDEFIEIDPSNYSTYGSCIIRGVTDSGYVSQAYIDDGY